MDKVKTFGQVFTPDWVVKEMLDKADYKGKRILNKKIFEPSFGDGAFLMQIVDRYIKEAKRKNWSNKKTQEGLEKNIFGVEIDNSLYEKCIFNLNNISKDQGLPGVNWSLKNEDALQHKLKKDKYDFIIGNPPYVRVHNLDKDVIFYLKNNYDFCKNGMIDIYLAFFELGLNVLKKEGNLVYITPNMFFKNSSNQYFRNYLIENNFITDLVNFGSFQVFDDVNTYNCIIKLKKNNKKARFNYFEFLDSKITKVNEIKSSDYLEKKFVFTSLENANFITKKQKGTSLEDIANIQYGFATLRDKIYISADNTFEDKERKQILFNGSWIEESLVKDIVKGSRMYFNGRIRKERILFPYKKQKNKWIIIPEQEMKEKYKNTYKYLCNNRLELEKRSRDKGALWYEYGRSQGIQSIHKPKLILDALVNKKINVVYLDKDVMVYSGIFITSESVSLENLKRHLTEIDFYRYARIMGKDMQGGYKSINTKIIKEYSIEYA